MQGKNQSNKKDQSNLLEVIAINTGSMSEQLKVLTAINSGVNNLQLQIADVLSLMLQKGGTNIGSAQVPGVEQYLAMSGGSIDQDTLFEKIDTIIQLLSLMIKNQDQGIQNFLMSLTDSKISSLIESNLLIISTAVNNLKEQFKATRTELNKLIASLTGFFVLLNTTLFKAGMKSLLKFQDIINAFFDKSTAKAHLNLQKTRNKGGIGGSVRSISSTLRVMAFVAIIPVIVYALKEMTRADINWGNAFIFLGWFSAFLLLMEGIPYILKKFDDKILSEPDGSLKGAATNWLNVSSQVKSSKGKSVFSLAAVLKTFLMTLVLAKVNGMNDINWGSAFLFLGWLSAYMVTVSFIPSVLGKLSEKYFNTENKTNIFTLVDIFKIYILTLAMKEVNDVNWGNSFIFLGWLASYIITISIVPKLLTKFNDKFLSKTDSPLITFADVFKTVILALVTSGLDKMTDWSNAFIFLGWFTSYLVMITTVPKLLNKIKFKKRKGKYDDDQHTILTYSDVLKVVTLQLVTISSKSSKIDWVAAFGIIAYIGFMIIAMRAMARFQSKGGKVGDLTAMFPGFGSGAGKALSAVGTGVGGAIQTLAIAAMIISLAFSLVIMSIALVAFKFVDWSAAFKLIVFILTVTTIVTISSRISGKGRTGLFGFALGISLLLLTVDAANEIDWKGSYLVIEFIANIVLILTLGNLLSGRGGSGKLTGLFGFSAGIAILILTVNAANQIDWSGAFKIVLFILAVTLCLMAPQLLGKNSVTQKVTGNFNMVSNKQPNIGKMMMYFAIGIGIILLAVDACKEVNWEYGLFLITFIGLLTMIMMFASGQISLTTTGKLGINNSRVPAPKGGFWQFIGIAIAISLVTFVMVNAMEKLSTISNPEALLFNSIIMLGIVFVMMEMIKIAAKMSLKETLYGTLILGITAVITGLAVYAVLPLITAKVEDGLIKKATTMFAVIGIMLAAVIGVGLLITATPLGWLLVPAIITGSIIMATAISLTKNAAEAFLLINQTGPIKEDLIKSFTKNLLTLTKGILKATDKIKNGDLTKTHQLKEMTEISGEVVKIFSELSKINLESQATLNAIDKIPLIVEKMATALSNPNIGSFDGIKDFTEKAENGALGLIRVVQSIVTLIKDMANGYYDVWGPDKNGQIVVTSKEKIDWDDWGTRAASNIKTMMLSFMNTLKGINYNEFLDKTGRNRLSMAQQFADGIAPLIQLVKDAASIEIFKNKKDFDVFWPNLKTVFDHFTDIGSKLYAAKVDITKAQSLNNNISTYLTTLDTFDLSKINKNLTELLTLQQRLFDVYETDISNAKSVMDFLINSYSSINNLDKPSRSKFETVKGLIETFDGVDFTKMTTGVDKLQLQVGKLVKNINSINLKKVLALKDTVKVMSDMKMKNNQKEAIKQLTDLVNSLVDYSKTQSVTSRDISRNTMELSEKTQETNNKLEEMKKDQSNTAISIKLDQVIALINNIFDSIPDPSVTTFKTNPGVVTVKIKEGIF